jgi:hypothetical protein
MDFARTEEEVEEQRGRVLDQMDAAGGRSHSKWPGMTFEQGVLATIEWLLGDRDDPPIEETA